MSVKVTHFEKTNHTGKPLNMGSVMPQKSGHAICGRELDENNQVRSTKEEVNCVKCLELYHKWD